MFLNKFKKNIGLAIILIALSFVAINNVSLFKLSGGLFGNIAFADDDEEEYDDEAPAPAPVVQDTTYSSLKTEKTTQVIQLPDQIVTKTIIETIYEDDSDGDGLIDKNDPHPTIPEIYIVTDDNLNGIDDNYEIG